MFNDKMAKYSNSGLSPFVGNAKVFLVDLLHDNKDQNCEVEKFLKMFGKHIHSLKIKESKLPNSLILAKYLDLTPNLKQLTGKLNICESYSDHFNEINLPPDLVSLSISVKGGCQDTRTRLLNKLCFNFFKPHCRQHLKKLAVDWPNQWSLKFYKLRELCLKIDYIEYPRLKSITRDTFFFAFLKKLHLKTARYSQINFKRLIKAIGLLPSLKYLKLSDRTWDSLIIETTANIPKHNNIHTVELANFDPVSAHPIELFRAFPNLKYLKIRLNSRESHGLCDIVDKSPNLFPYKLFTEDKDLIYENKLWELVPNLEIITLEFYKHKCDSCNIRLCSLPQKGGSFKTQSAFNECRLVNVVTTREGYIRHSRDLPQIGN